VSRMGVLPLQAFITFPMSASTAIASIPTIRWPEALRGYSGPQTAWAYESQMDHHCREIRSRSVQVTLKNSYDENSIHSGARCSRTSPSKRAEKVAEAMAWEKSSSIPFRGRGVAFWERGSSKLLRFIRLHQGERRRSVELLSSTRSGPGLGNRALPDRRSKSWGYRWRASSKATPIRRPPFDDRPPPVGPLTYGQRGQMAAADAREQILKLRQIPRSQSR